VTSATSPPGGPLPIDGTVVVVGASLAGLRATETLRAEGFDGRILMVGEEAHLPYDRPPLSKQVLAGTWPPERTVLADRTKLDGYQAELVLGHRAIGLDPVARTVELDDGSTLRADGVVVATGARPRRLPGVQGQPTGRVLRTLDDAMDLRAAITSRDPRCTVVVIGAGFIGSEVASTCSGLGCAVTVVEALATPLEPALGPTVGAACAALHVRHGVELRTGTGVAALRTVGEGATVVELADGMVLPADVVVEGIGVVPATEWLQGSGLEIGDGLHCDAALFAADGVVAAGDLARWPHAGIGHPVRIEHWQVAAEMGVAAARSLMAGRAEAAPFVPIPYFWSDQYGMRIQVLGHPAPDDDVEVVHGTLDSERFVVVYGRDGRLTAALGLGRPRQLMAFRPLLAAGATVAEARALELG